MSAIANIAVQDGQATPVTHTFTPRSAMPASYRNGSSVSSALGLVYDETILVDVNLQPKGVSKVKITLATPHLDSVAGAQYYETAKVEFMIPPNSSAANRKDIRTLLKNLLADSQIVDAIDNLAAPY